MSGFVDSVSRIWITKIDRGALDVDGFTTPVKAIEQLIRSEMVQDDSAQHKAFIRDRVELALRHMDEVAGRSHGGSDE